LQAAAGFLDLAVLGFDLGILVGQLVRLAFQLGVDVLEFGLLRLEFVFELLRLLAQQHLGAGRRLDRIEHDAQAVRQLVQEVQVDRLERLERGQLDHRLHLALEQDRQQHDIARTGLAQPGHDLNVVVRQVGDQDALLLERGLAHQAFADAPLARQVLALLVAVAGHQGEHGSGT